VLVTRFWYIRFTDPQSMTFTGMTRDGLWRIENGRVTTPLLDWRWNDSAFRVLENIEDSGIPLRTGEFLDMRMPALKVKDFNFTSLSGGYAE
jgi:predicted Zn-dependent protease